MKLAEINEAKIKKFGDIQKELRSVMSIVRGLKSESSDRQRKKEITKAINKLDKIITSVPKNDLAYITGFLKKILTLPLSLLGL